MSKQFGRMMPAKLYRTNNFVIPAGNPGECLGERVGTLHELRFTNVP